MAQLTAAGLGNCRPSPDARVSKMATCTPSEREWQSWAKKPLVQGFNYLVLLAFFKGCQQCHLAHARAGGILAAAAQAYESVRFLTAQQGVICSLFTSVACSGFFYERGLLRVWLDRCLARERSEKIQGKCRGSSGDPSDWKS